MSIELDHIILLTGEGAPLANLLVEAGLVEGSSNIHPGQGTSNRRFFFQNTTLEFLYVHDLVETTSGPAQGLRFGDRSLDSDASPFGLVMRTVKGDAEIPFDGWKYCPDYFASDMCFFVGVNSNNLKEPLCICMPDNLSQRKDLPIPENPNLALTELIISIPVLKASNPLLAISKCQNIVIELDKPNRLELTFNNGVHGKRHDFTSKMPLILNW
ncbi:MAG: hypothetical protein AB8B64_12880 [Granulosicoccus sp.]